MQYEEALEAINSLRHFGARPGLERIEKLLFLLGSPQKKLKFVHVAGTNGKGSSSTLISSVLSAAGYQTGLFVSPYVSDFCERFQINAHMIPHEVLSALVEEIWPVAQRISEEDAPITMFEFITAVGMLWFSRSACDVVVLEVGLGGRLDATNAIGTPLVSVICPISFDHTAILGNTLTQIAHEKCGIIKPYGTTVCSPAQDEEAFEVIKNTAQEQHNSFVQADLTAIEVKEMTLYGTHLVWNQINLLLPLLGEHQVNNAATALATLNCLKKQGFKIETLAFQEGFAAARIPARMELLSQEPVVLLDGAHNPAGTAVLAKAVRSFLGNQPITALVGMLADKDALHAVQNLQGLFSNVITVSPNSPRALSAEKLAELFKEGGTPAHAAQSVQEGTESLLKATKTASAVICGSLYLAGEVRLPLQNMLKK